MHVVEHDPETRKDLNSRAAYLCIVCTGLALVLRADLWGRRVGEAARRWGWLENNVCVWHPPAPSGARREGGAEASMSSSGSGCDDRRIGSVGDNGRRSIHTFLVFRTLFEFTISFALFISGSTSQAQHDAHLVLLPAWLKSSLNAVGLAQLLPVLSAPDSDELPDTD